MTRSVKTIFCDDVRQEVNGKYSIIGAYAENLFIAEFPATLPKLCIIVQTFSDNDDAFTKFNIEILQGKDVMASQDVDLSEIPPSPQSSISGGEGDYNPITTQSIFIMSPYHADRPKNIQVRLHADGVTYLAPGLIIDKAPEGMLIV